MLVEPLGASHAQRLERGGRPFAPRPAVGRKRRSRAEGHKLLRALPARDRRDVAALRRRKTGFFHNDSISRVGLGKARRDGQRWARRFCCSSGTTPLGTSPRRSGDGSGGTTAASKRAQKG